MIARSLFLNSHLRQNIFNRNTINPIVRFMTTRTPISDKIINFTFIEKGESIPVQGREGESILDVARKYDVDLEGACEGSVACSTCHVILEEKVYKKLEEPTDEEYDMLDLAFSLTDTSRLGCQVILNDNLEGAIVKLPAATRNMMVDGHVPKHH
eukprot:c5570_g1_i1.p1 GENE.c5570_g1_i1~~c5570_g1_i1.p1  ORF type:complete len:162 (+),score=56.24 c5570_g1_i1:22-486(+)